MKKESLDVAIEVIVHAIAETEIDIRDRIELMINIREFLKSEKYKENIKVLKKASEEEIERRKYI